MRTNQAGKRGLKVNAIIKSFIILVLIIVCYWTYSYLKLRTGYIVWTSDSVLYTSIDYEEALNTDFTKLSWGKWFYLEQDSKVNEIYRIVSSGISTNEYIFQKVKIKYMNLILPYTNLPTYIDDSRISKIYVFNIEIFETPNNEKDNPSCP